MDLDGPGIGAGPLPKNRAPAPSGHFPPPLPEPNLPPISPFSYQKLRALCAVVVGLVFYFFATADLDLDKLRLSFIAHFNATHGSAPLRRFDDWRRLLLDSREAGESEKLHRINDFFNHTVRYDTDQNIWGQNDYWATPLETLALARGDCEDYAIAKYFSLINLGIPLQKLRIVYVKITISDFSGRHQEPHMVLAYYKNPEGEPLILDSLNGEILSASQRPDLKPIFSFNSAGVWFGTGNLATQSNLSRWQDLLKRVHAEGF